MAEVFDIPTDYQGVTLRQYVDYKAAKDDIERVMAVTGMTHKQARSLKMDSIRFIVSQMETVLAVEMASRIIEGKRTVKVNGRLYGLIPDLEQMRFDEFIDASALSQAAYNGDQPDLSNLIDLFCVLFRPVTEKVGDKYRIQDYDGDKISEYRADIEQFPMDVVTGTLLFFSAILTELVTASLQYLEEEMRKSLTETMQEEQPTQASLAHTDGTTSSRQSPKGTLHALTRFFAKKRTRYSPT